jgi:hypothetical protein
MYFSTVVSTLYYFVNFSPFLFSLLFLSSSLSSSLFSSLSYTFFFFPLLSPLLLFSLLFSSSLYPLLSPLLLFSFLVSSLVYLLLSSLLSSSLPLLPLFCRSWLCCIFGFNFLSSHTLSLFSLVEKVATLAVTSTIPSTF